MSKLNKSGGDWAGDGEIRELVLGLKRCLNGVEDALAAASGSSGSKQIHRTVSLLRRFTAELMMRRGSWGAFSTQVLSVQDIWNLSQLLTNKNEQLREESFIILKMLMERYENLKSLSKEIIVNHLITAEREKECVDKLILLAGHLLNGWHSVPEREAIYHEVVLPNALKVLDFGSTVHTVRLFCSRSPSCQLITIKWVSRSLHTLDSAQHPQLLAISAVVIDTYTNSDTLPGLLSDILFKALSTENYLVLDAVYELFECRSFKAFFKRHIHTLLPPIFPVLYKQSKVFWRTEQRCKILLIVKYMLELDENLFEECLIQYNINKMLKIHKNK